MVGGIACTVAAPNLSGVFHPAGGLSPAAATTSSHFVANGLARGGELGGSGCSRSRP